MAYSFFKKSILMILLLWSVMGFAASFNTELFTEDELHYIKTHPVIRVGNGMDYVPFDFVVGNEPCGYSVDLIQMIADYAGLKIEFVNGYTWSELLKLFKQGKLDLMHMVNKTKEREAYALFSKPYFMHPPDVFLTNGDGDVVHSIKQLYGKKVAVGKDWAVHAYLLKNHPKVDVVTMDSVELVLDALVSKKVDAAINGLVNAEYLIRKHNYNNISIAGVFNEFPQFDTQKCYFIGQKNAPFLISIFNKVFRRLSASDLESLKKKWLGPTTLLKAKDDSISLNYEEKEYLKNKGTISYCIDPDWMPYEKIDEDGKHIGITADYIELLSKRLGVEFQLIPTSSWKESLLSLKSKKCDLLPFVTPTHERKLSFDFVEAYSHFSTVIVTKREHIPVTSLEDLSKKIFVCMEGYALSSPLISKYPNIKLVRVKSIGEGFRLIKDGAAFGYIDLAPAVMYMMRSCEVLDLKVSYTLPVRGRHSFAVHKGEGVLKGILQKVVNSLTDEEHKRVYQKWLAVTIKKVKDYSLIWRIIAVASILLGLFLYWNRKLQFAKESVEIALKAEQDAVQQNINLIDMISHEYRTPLSVINSCIDLVERKYCLDSLPGIEKQLSSMREASQRLLNIFESSLNKNVGRYDVSVKLEQFNIIELVDLAISFMRCTYPRHIFSVSFEKKKCIVCGDKELMMTAVSNLLDNACKYSKGGSRVIVRISNLEVKCLIEIEDQGNGIGKADIQNIFTKFYRSEHAGDKRGSGIGLFMVKQILDIHEGSISVESVLGQGSSFKVLIPIINLKGKNNA